MKKLKLPVEKNVQFLLCEDIRHEVSGKATLVGFYPGATVVVHGPPPGVPDIVAILHSLSLLFVLPGGSGTAKAKIEILDPDGKRAYAQDLGEIKLEETGSATIAGQLRPFAVKHFGVYHTVLSIGRKNFRFAFELRKGDS